MCLEVFCPGSPIQIPYEHEVLQFTSATEYVGRYTLLLQNRSHIPIDRISAIYPRRLFTVEADSQGRPTAVLNGVTDVTSEIPSYLQGLRSPGSGRLSLEQPDPNSPQYVRPVLEGSWLPSESIEWDIPASFTPGHINALNNMGYACWYGSLKTPIPPYSARWLSWKVEAGGAGTPVGETVLGLPVVYHQVASPVDVHRTISEMCETSIRLSQLANFDWGAAIFRDIMNEFGLKFRREVDVQYFEMVIEPGDPTERLIIGWTMERDLRMRTGSPRFVSNPHLTTPNGIDPIRFEWKSGNLLKPEHDWTDCGFILHFTMLARELLKQN